MANKDIKDVVVYTKANCPACRMTERWLDEHNVEYITHNLVDAQGTVLDEDLYNDLKESGYKQFPVVETYDLAAYLNDIDVHQGYIEGWCGYQPTKLRQLL